VLNCEKEFYNIPRPKKPIQNLSVFGKSEVQRIPDNASNLKHKALLMIGYSSGLRVREIVNLCPVDIDSSRMVINIRRAKGKKDRIVPLSENLLIILRAYYCEVNPRLKVYLSEGQPGKRYSVRSVQMILRTAKSAAMVRKGGSNPVLARGTVAANRQFASMVLPNTGACYLTPVFGGRHQKLLHR
jgi:integrase/recombinase XerD